MEARNVNIYFVPNNKNKIGGRFYNVYINRNEKLDLGPFLNSIIEIDELEEKVQEQDSTFKTTGGIILKKDEEIKSATVYTENNGDINISYEQQDAYDRWIQLDKLSNELYSQRKKELEEFIDNQRMIDDKLSFIQ